MFGYTLKLMPCIIDHSFNRNCRFRTPRACPASEIPYIDFFGDFKHSVQKNPSGSNVVASDFVRNDLFQNGYCPQFYDTQ